MSSSIVAVSSLMARGGSDLDLELVKEEPPDGQWIKAEVDIEEHELLQHPRVRAALPAPAESQLPVAGSSVSAGIDALPDTRQAAPERDIKLEPESSGKGNKKVTVTQDAYVAGRWFNPRVVLLDWGAALRHSDRFCTDCGRLCTSRSTLRRHQQAHLEQDNDSINMNGSKTPDVPKHNKGLNENTLRPRGRPPKRKQGRPKTSEKSRKDQLREANQRYRKAHPKVAQNALKRSADKHPEAHRMAVKRYTDNNPEVNQKAVKLHTENNPDVHQKAANRYGNSKNERQRNNRLRQAANLANASNSLETTTTSPSRSGEESNNVQTKSQRQHAQQQSTTTADQPVERVNLTNEPLFPAIPVPMEVQEAVASTSATLFAEPTRAQIQQSKHLLTEDFTIVKIEYVPETGTSQPAPERGVKVEPESVLGEGRVVKTEVEDKYSVHDNHLLTEDFSIKVEYVPETGTSQPSPERGVKVEPESVLGECRVVKTEVEDKSSVCAPECDYAPRPPEGAGVKAARRYECDICRFTTKTRTHIVRHLRTHTEEKRFKCNLCDYRSDVRSHFTDHMRTHTGEKPFKCNLCDFRSVTSSNLTNHIRTHTGEKPFKCNLCDYRSVQRSCLTSHLRTHTGEKPFKCNLCDYRSSRRGRLTSHMRTHTGEKPFKCYLCDYRSVTRSNLTQHMITHTEEKQFKCNLCDYRSAVRSHVAHHMRTHTGEKPFECSVCEHRFNIRSNLSRHMRTHMGEKPVK